MRIIVLYRTSIQEIIKVVYNFVVFFCFCFLVVRNRYLGSVLIPVLSKEPILLIPQLCLAVLLLNK
jgi:hypothetical protein